MEAIRDRSRVRNLAVHASPLVASLVPDLVALATGILGSVCLLASSALVHEALEATGRIPVLPPFEGSLVGASLLVLAHGLRRRVRAAWAASVAVLSGFAVWSSATGRGGFGLAGFAAAVAAVFAVSGFPRRSALLESGSRGRVLLSATFLVAALLAAHGWLARHPEAEEMSLAAFLRRGPAPAGVRLTVAGIWVLYLGVLLAAFRPTRPRTEVATCGELDRVQAILERSGRADARLALSGDKAVLFDPEGRGFLAYAVTGRTFVALGDPVGPPEVRRELAWSLSELADRHGGRVAFYQVRPEDLDLYLELGLTPRKLGEEARVPLAGFELEGKPRRESRRVLRKLAEAGYRLEVVPASGVAELVPELAKVSAAWLGGKRAREKGFSLGRFDPAYLGRLPLAVVRGPTGIAAFANVLGAADRDELTIDLMRFPEDAPSGVMEFLIVSLMVWGREQGYAWFGLGMAPLTGIEDRQGAPAWNRLAALVRDHGEGFYNFHGLRRFKDRFDPVWSPRYLAAPGGSELARIVVQIGALIGGGIRGVVAK